MEEDEMGGGGKKPRQRKGNPLANTKRKADNLSKGASKASEVMAKSAEKRAQKAMTQSGAKAAKSMTIASKRAKQAEKLSKVAKNAQKVSALIGKLGPIIATVGMIVLLIISIIGILVFILAGLGLILSGLESIATAFGDKLFALVSGSQNIVHDEEIVDTLKYLQEMDYDLYGYGFSRLPNPLEEEKDEEGNVTKTTLTYKSPGFFTNTFQAIDMTMEHNKAYRNIIAYLISDNYATILQHKNITIGDFFAGNPGKGLLAVYHETELGKKGDGYDAWELGSITVKDNKLKVVEKGILKRSIMEYDLSGWTGRYGMPLEFLLSVHLATMAPDLSYKMATESAMKTEVQILLHAISGNIDSSVGPTINNKVPFSVLTEINDGFIGDDLRLNPKEAYEIFEASDGILESYTGNELTQYMCMGPPDYTGIGEQYGGNWNADTSVQEVTKESVRECIEKLISGAGDVEIPKESVDSLINEIYNFFQNGTTQVASADLLKKTSANHKRFATEEGGKFELEYINTITKNKTYKFLFQGKEFEVPITVDPELPTDIEGNNRLGRLVEDIKKEIEKLKEPSYIVDNTTEIESLVLGIINGTNPIEPNTSVSISATKISGNKNESDSENNDENTDENNKDDSDKEENNQEGTEKDSLTQIFYSEGKYKENSEAIFKFEITHIDNGDGTGMWQANLYYSDGRSDKAEHCSDPCPQDSTQGLKNEVGEACINCIRYLKHIYKALKETNNSDLDTYVPYIYRVKDHWFRDVYFTHYAIEDAGDDTIIKNDDEYEKKTGERWTLYDTDDKGNYKLYVYLKDENNNYNDKLSDILCQKVKRGNGKYKLSDDGITYVKAEGNEGEYNLEPEQENVEEFRVGKKAIKDDTITSSSDYMAYELGTTDSNWQTLQINESSPQYLQDIQASGLNIYFQQNTGTIKQVEDGVRGETDPAIKKLFLDDYYLYDGTPGTAALIQKAKEMTGTNDPDDFKNNFAGTVIETDLLFKDDDGDETKEHYKATIDQISGAISLSHSSLNAFSILENMHTLDSEYIYRDFKELIVELNYFDKEDLVEPESEVMMFPVANVSAAGWPVARYDKNENFYGTLIHSAEDLRALKTQTISELMELLSEEEIPDDPSTEEQPTNNTENNETQPINSDNPLVLAAADVAAILTSTQESDYCQGTGNSENGSRGHTDHHRSVTLSELQTYLKTDCSGFVSICLQQVGILGEGESFSSGSFKNALESKGATIISNPTMEQLEPGMICVYSGHVNIYAGNNMFYDWGAPTNNLPKAYNKAIVYAIKIDSTQMKYNGVSGTNTGSNSNSSTAEFAGFEGGETVVAPITGEVLEYGTMERKNVETGEKNEVGFIKIRALGTKQCKPGTEDGCEYFSGVSQKNINNAITASDVEENDASGWLEKNAQCKDHLDTLGYDYFWKEYDDAGIGDCIVYLEGFDVSDIKVSGNRDSNIQILANYINALEEDSESEIKNSYSPQYSVPNLLDNKREFELKIAEEAKQKAVYTLPKGSGKNKKIYIKEGAAIGKTFSSEAEFMKEIEIKELEDEENKTPTEQVTPETETEQDAGPYKVGNYLKILLLDTEEQKVENVEDYVEIPQSGNSEAGLYAGFNTEVTQEEAEMLAAVILAENGEHMDAVCQVIKNRGNDTAHNGDVITIADVLTKTGQYGTVFPVGGNTNPERKGGYGSAPNGSYTRVYELGEYGQFVVGNQPKGGTFNEREATDESRSIVEGVLSGSIEDVISPKLGKLALFQVTLKDYGSHLGEPHCVEAGELFSHLWKPLKGESDSCACTLSN